MTMLPAGVAAVLLGTPVAAPAGDGLAAPVDHEPQAVVGGEYAQTCEYPASVGLNTAGCSGTLIHPEIVLFAAHCGSPGRIELGESWSSTLTVGTEYCRRYPNWSTSNGTDLQFCKLVGAAYVPIAPIATGCEPRQLEVGSHVIPVGFGRETAGPPGTPGAIGRKKWLHAEILGFPSYGRLIGIQGVDPEEGICNGDSGGSLYFQLDDGSWRMIGVTSTSSAGCPTPSQHVASWRAVEFIESESGIDVTPCTDADGTWNPGPDCGGFALDVTSGEGLSWSDGCAGAPLSELSSACGPAYGDPPDEDPPRVTIVEPADGTELAGSEADVDVTLDVDDVDRWGTRDVTFEVSGDPGVDTTVLESEPWEVGSVILSEGVWTLTAAARDWSGNTSVDTVRVYVGVEAPDDPGTSSGTEDGTTDESGTNTSTETTTRSDDDGPDETDDDADGDGCGCAASPASASILFGLFALARRRPRL
jgi:hypothetical protein